MGKNKTRLKPRPKPRAATEFVSQLKRLADDSYLLTTKYGSTQFPNLQKFYKFQLQCKHQETYIWDEVEYQEEMCYRCRSCVRKIPVVVNRDAELPDTWADDGGRSP